MSNLSHWDAATKFTGREAAALAVGVDPGPEAVAKSSPMFERMESSYNAKRRWYEDDGRPPQSDEADDAVTPQQMLESCEMRFLATTESEDSGVFLDWLRDERRSGFESQQFTREEIARWLLEIGISSVYPFGKQEPPLASEKPLGTKERQSMLKLIGGMAMAYYKYDPTNKSLIAKVIANDLHVIGISIDEDTVLKYLKESAEVVFPGKTPKP